ncbi:MAG: AMP-binding protein [Calditrichaceae bacterium]|nr:AMP-binding protein [Calditrichaceae bacterium]MBN2709293.1 AMP-binding protein [Calditrichaceae bacterium]RQV91989.1 MAG: bifunctional acyl-ACP--phospholipid O-acyltransferase/long-chain-fatty-acid--ACP ligase [Calditrichota bacterium]
MILHEAFIKRARGNGKKMAIIDGTTGQKATYSKSLIVTLLFAELFSSYEDKFIGLMIPTSAGGYLATMGVLASGKVPVMINYSTGADENCKYAQQTCGFRTIVTSKALCEKIGCPKVDGMIYLEELAESFSKMAKIKALVKSKLPLKMILSKLPATSEDDTACILFTSGSESEPKAVQLSHKNIGSNVEDIISLAKLTEKDRIMNTLPVFHVFGLTTGFWVPMLSCMVITYANPLELKNIVKLIINEKPTLIPSTPSFLAGYLKQSKPGDFESLRLIVPGGDKTPEWLRKAFRETHNIELMEGYGTTETSPVISVNTPEANKPGSVGKAVPHAKIKITDVETGEELGAGEEGKILVKGDLVMKGYFDDLEATSLRVRDGWYDTGDMGYLDKDGFLWHSGRLKRFAKIGGEMISMIRTERMLEKLLPDGVECCVIELPDPKKGARIMAAVTEPVNKEVIIRELSKTLPALAIPSSFEVIPEMPKMGNGKINFRQVTNTFKEKHISHLKNSASAHKSKAHTENKF